MGGSPSFPIVNFTSDHIVIVTGANTGIGYEVVKWIAMMGAHVIMACRSEERALAAIERMREEFKEEKKKGKMTTDEISVEYSNLDLSSLKSVSEFVEAFKSTDKKLNTLICNAGVAMHRQEYTEDDNETHFQVNYLGHFLLTVKLLPVMRQSGDDCRVINVSSFVHTGVKWKLDEVQGRQYTAKDFNRWQYYVKSKAYQIMQMYTMNSKLTKSNVKVLCINPGLVETELDRSYKDMKCLSCCIKCGALFAGKKPYQGAVCAIDVAVNPKYKGVGDIYYTDCKEEETARLTRDKEVQKQLWEYSLEKLSGYLTETDMAVFDN